MSKYTTEVRFICETYAGMNESSGGNSVNDIISRARSKVFDFDFPIFDENYRSVLETKILKHFYTREIGYETVGLWKIKLDTKLNEIMPYYNKMYLSELFDVHPLYATNITREHKGKKDDDEKRKGKVTSETTSTGKGNGTSSNTSYTLYSDTPQGALTGVDNETYLTNATKVTDSGSTSSSTHNESDSTIDNTEDKQLRSTDEYIDTIKGYEGYDVNSLLKSYRDNILNIDLMIIDELENLFIQLW